MYCLPDIIGNNHRCEQCDDTGREDRIPANDVARNLQVLQFGRSNLPVNLRQRFETAHRQQRVSEGDNDGHNRNSRPDCSFEPTRGFVAQNQVARHRRRRKVPFPLNDDRERTPDQERNYHNRGDLHDSEGRRTRFFNALDVAPPEIQRNEHAKKRGEHVGIKMYVGVRKPAKLID